jgi:hypothetical protein
MADYVRKKAVAMIEFVKEELALGTKHYHPTTREFLPDTLSIVRCLKSEGSVDMVPVKGRVPGSERLDKGVSLTEKSEAMVAACLVSGVVDEDLLFGKMREMMPTFEDDQLRNGARLLAIAYQEIHKLSN